MKRTIRRFYVPVIDDGSHAIEYQRERQPLSGPVRATSEKQLKLRPDKMSVAGIYESSKTMMRHYQPEDTDALVSVWQKANALAHPFLREDFVAQVAKDMRNIYLPNAETWVLEDDGNPAGFIALVGTEIGGLFLDPVLHGRGLGKAMTDHAVELQGPLTVEVFERNSIGRQFYDRYGFSETDRYTHEPSGEVTIKMAMPTK